MSATNKKVHPTFSAQQDNHPMSNESNARKQRYAEIEDAENYGCWTRCIVDYYWAVMLVTFILSLGLAVAALSSGQGELGGSFADLTDLKTLQLYAWYESKEDRSSSDTQVIPTRTEQLADLEIVLKSKSGNMFSEENMESLRQMEQLVYNTGGWQDYCLLQDSGRRDPATSDVVYECQSPYSINTLLYTNPGQSESCACKEIGLWDDISCSITNSTFDYGQMSLREDALPSSEIRSVTQRRNILNELCTIAGLGSTTDNDRDDDGSDDSTTTSSSSSSAIDWSAVVGYNVTSTGLINALASCQSVVRAVDADLIGDRFTCDNARNGWNTTTKFVRTFMSMGLPLAGYRNADDDTDDQIGEVSDYLSEGFLGDIFKYKDRVEGDNGDVTVYFRANYMGLTLYFLNQDLLWIGGSVVVVFIILLLGTSSIFLSLAGIYEILVSFPLGLFVWYLVLQEEYVTYLMYLGVFIILGIGADDVFVFYNTWRQSEAQPYPINKNLYTRFHWAYHRSASSMFLTSMTTLAAFLAASAHPMWDIRCFGAVNGVMVFCDYLLVITWFPACVICYEKHFKKCWSYSTCLQKVCCCIPGVGGRKQDMEDEDEEEEEGKDNFAVEDGAGKGTANGGEESKGEGGEGGAGAGAGAAEGSVVVGRRQVRIQTASDAGAGAAEGPVVVGRRQVRTQTASDANSESKQSVDSATGIPKRKDRRPSLSDFYENDGQGEGGGGDGGNNGKPLRPGQLEAQTKSMRHIDRFFHGKYFRTLHLVRFPILVFGLFLLISSTVVWATGLKAAKSAPNDFASDHFVRENARVFDKEFGSSDKEDSIRIHAVYGIRPGDPLDNDDTHPADPFSRGDVKYVPKDTTTRGSSGTSSAGSVAEVVAALESSDFNLGPSEQDHLLDSCKTFMLQGYTEEQISLTTAGSTIIDLLGDGSDTAAPPRGSSAGSSYGEMVPNFYWGPYCFLNDFYWWFTYGNTQRAHVYDTKGSLVYDSSLLGGSSSTSTSTTSEEEDFDAMMETLGFYTETTTLVSLMEAAEDGGGGGLASALALSGVSEGGISLYTLPSILRNMTSSSTSGSGSGSGSGSVDASNMDGSCLFPNGSFPLRDEQALLEALAFWKNCSYQMYDANLVDPNLYRYSFEFLSAADPNYDDATDYWEKTTTVGGDGEEEEVEYVQMAWMGFNSTLSTNYDNTAAEQKELNSDMGDAMMELNTVARSSSYRLSGYQTCEVYDWMAAQELLVASGISNMAISMAVSIFVLALFVQNWVLVPIGAFCLYLIVSLVFCMMVLSKWEINVIESICLTIAAGLAVDYVVHMIHAYQESPCRNHLDRAHFMLSVMATSVCSGCFTTIGAAAMLFGTQLLWFNIFGQFIAMIIFCSFIVAILILPPILMVMGPDKGFGDVPLTAFVKSLFSQSQDRDAKTADKKANDDDGDNGGVEDAAP